MGTQFSKFALVAGIMLALVFTFSCSDDDSGNDDETGGSYDSDKGNDIANYKTKKIGSQTWMAENLNYNVEGSKCFGEGSSMVVIGYTGVMPIYGTLSNVQIKANCAKYGRLYDYETANTVCPSGWHLPSSDEFTTLIDFVGGSETAGTKLKAKNGWNFSWQGNPINGNGTDSYGFSALPGGSGIEGGIEFGGLGGISITKGFWWSATENNASTACALFIDYNENADECNSSLGTLKSALLSVRCVKDY